MLPRPRLCTCTGVSKPLLLNHQNRSTMSTIVMHLMFVINMFLGSSSNSQVSQNAFKDGNSTYNTQAIVIIDGDELGGRR